MNEDKLQQSKYQLVSEVYRSSDGESAQSSAEESIMVQDLICNAGESSLSPKAISNKTSSVQANDTRLGNTTPLVSNDFNTISVEPEVKVLEPSDELRDEVEIEQPIAVTIQSIKDTLHYAERWEDADLNFIKTIRSLLLHAQQDSKC